MRILTLAAAAGLFLAGCKMGPNYERPAVATPAGWRTPAPGATSIAQTAWWDFYGDPVLTNLITTALANNQDLRIAAARVEESLGLYRSQRSFLLPGVDASASGTRARSGYTGLTGNNYDVFGLLSYEVDLWGRVRRLTEAARAQYLASEESQRTVYIGLVAGVANSYFNLQSLDAQLEVARRTYVSRTNSLALVRVRFNEIEGQGQGIASELDVRQAETQVYGAQASIAVLERAVAVAENDLSFLLGFNPGPLPRGATEPELPADIPAGLPSELLLRRPDIRAAEQLLIGANANIGAARAAYFPTLSLTAAFGVQSLELDDLFKGASRAWSFSPQVVAPIFQGGRIRAGVQIAEAQKRAALAAYQQSIQNAFREVDNALVSVAKLREEVVAWEANVKAERRRLELSNARYNEGIATYSDVLDAERSLFNAELQALQTQADLKAAGAQLYKALGGGWEGPLSEKGSSAPTRHGPQE